MAHLVGKKYMTYLYGEEKKMKMRKPNVLWHVRARSVKSVTA